MPLLIRSRPLSLSLSARGLCRVVRVRGASFRAGAGHPAARLVPRLARFRLNDDDEIN